MALDTAARKRRASIAAHAGWANTTNRRARTEHGRTGLTRKIEADCIVRINAKHGDGAWDAMTPADQAKALDSARTAHFKSMSDKAKKAREAAKATTCVATTHLETLVRLAVFIEAASSLQGRRPDERLRDRGGGCRFTQHD
jgi:hypothetical protein